MKSKPKGEEGLRDRKRRQMYRHITDIGLKLFAEHGYEETTVDAIAGASGIARRTFFHYFSSKEEIIQIWQRGMPEELYLEIHRQGGQASPAATIQAALTALAVHMDPHVALLIGRIVQSTEQLRLGNQAKFLHMEQSAHDALCDIWPDPMRNIEMRLAAMVGVGTLRLSIEAWIVDECNKPLTNHLAENFERLSNEVKVSSQEQGING